MEEIPANKSEDPVIILFLLLVKSHIIIVLSFPSPLLANSFPLGLNATDKT